MPGADLLILALENMLAPCGVPFVHQLPPTSDGELPDAVFYYGGDDEGSDGLQAKMSEIMTSLGLPYHINIMLGRDDAHHFTDADRAVYERNGHEISMHLNFMDFPEGVQHPAPVTEAEYDRQFRRFTERYGFVPVCSNNHCCRTSGWADTARMGAAHGVKGEHHRVHRPSLPMDPVNLFGAAFGTVFPHFVYDDAAHGNARIDFVDVPISFYEPGSVGYEPSHPFYHKDPFQPDEYRRVVGIACRQGWTLNFFVHPCHMLGKGSRTCDALRAILDEVERLAARVLHLGDDALCLWWHARARTQVAPSGKPGVLDVTTTYPSGVWLRLLCGSLPAGAVPQVDGRLAFRR